MRSCSGGVGLGDVVDILNPQAARRINGILVKDIIQRLLPRAERERVIDTGNILLMPRGNLKASFLFFF